MLIYFFLRSLYFIEAREFRTQVIRRPGVGPVILSPENKPYKDIIHELKVDDLIAETYGPSLRKSPPKVGVNIIVRSMKEMAVLLDGPMDHSPGIGHGQPPAAPH